MKRVLCIITAWIIIINLSGCVSSKDIIKAINKFDNVLEDKDGRDESKKKTTIEIIIEGLDNRDAKLIKSVFSERAIELSPDIDEAIEYMFSIYDGKFEEIVYSNYESTKHYEKDGNTIVVTPVYVIRTTKKYYRICMQHWTLHEKEPSMQGVYSMYFVESDEEFNGGGSLWVAGIDCPKRGDSGIQMGKIVRALIFKSENTMEEFKEILSDSMLEKKDTLLQFDKFMNRHGMIMSSAVGDIWIEYEECKTYVYAMINIKSRFCICFSPDINQPDKISTLKVTEIEEGSTIDDYELKTDEIGIFLPWE